MSCFHDNEECSISLKISHFMLIQIPCHHFYVTLFPQQHSIFFKNQIVCFHIYIWCIYHIYIWYIYISNGSSFSFYNEALFFEAVIDSLYIENTREGNGNPLQLYLPGKSHGQRSLVRYSPWGHKRVRHGLPAETTACIEYIGIL